MKKTREKNFRFIQLAIIIILLISVIAGSWFLSSNKKMDTRSKAATSSLSEMCKDGYYDKCSRAPKCGGKSYDEVASLPAPNAQACMGDGKGGRSSKGCAGLVPLCCYELERTGDPLKCVGYWERLWCHPNQCAKVNLELGRECNAGELGDCNCGHATVGWCIEKDGLTSVPYVPLEQRLGLQVPSPTKKPKPPTSVLTKTQPTTTTKPIQPTIPQAPPTSYHSPIPTIKNTLPQPTLTSQVSAPTDVIFPPSPTKQPPTLIPTRAPIIDMGKTITKAKFIWSKIQKSIIHFTQTVLP